MPADSIDGEEGIYMYKEEKKTEQSLNVPIMQFFEMKKTPFPQTLGAKEIYLLPSVKEVAEMAEFAFINGMFYAVIGDVGSGKTSAIRYACSRLETRRATVISVVGGIWSFTEFLRQILATFGVDIRNHQTATMVRIIQDKLLAIQADGRKCIFMIDEAHLLKSDVFAQLHILSLREESKGPLFSLMLCGQEELAEKLSSPTAKPLMSRIATGYYIPPLKKEDFIAYIDHHLLLAGRSEQVFDNLGLDALWQVSNANLREIGRNALLAMQYAANSGMHTVTAECVRKSLRPFWQSDIHSLTAVSTIPDFSEGRRG